MSVLGFSSQVLYALSTTFSLPISPSLISSFSSSTPQQPTWPSTSAPQSTPSPWASHSTNPYPIRYLPLACSLPYTHIYITSSNATSVTLFSASAELSSPRIVISEKSLPVGPDLQEMQSLTCDRLALIDYVMLEHAAFFAGVTESSFSWNVAAKRRSLAAGVAGFCGHKEVPTEFVWKDE